MAQKRHCQFFVLKYVRSFSGEFINIGLLMWEPSESTSGFCGVRFVRNWEGVQAFDPDADIECLEAFSRDLPAQLQSSSREETIQTMLDSFSNAIQLSDLNERLTDDPEAEIEVLASEYLAGPTNSKRFGA